MSSVSSTNLEQSDSEVPGGRVKLWRVMVGMEQRDSTWRAIITRYWKGTDDGGKMKDKVLNSNSRRQGRTEKRTSPSRFSASRALRETKPRSKRRVSPRVRRAAEPHPQPRCMVRCASVRKGGTNSYHFYRKNYRNFREGKKRKYLCLFLFHSQGRASERFYLPGGRNGKPGPFWGT